MGSTSCARRQLVRPWLRLSGNNIRFGSTPSRNVGHAAVEAIIAARDDRPSTHSDFCERVDGARSTSERRVPDQVWRARLHRGDRKAMLACCRRRSRQARSRRRTRCAAGLVLRPRDGAGRGTGLRSQHPQILGPEFDQRELLAWRRERWGRSSPTIRSRRSARRCAGAPTAPWPSSRRA